MKHVRISSILYPIFIILCLAVASQVSFTQTPLGGTVFISGDDADDGDSHCPGSACGGTYAKALNFAVANS